MLPRDPRPGPAGRAGWHGRRPLPAPATGTAPAARVRSTVGPGAGHGRPVAGTVARNAGCPSADAGVASNAASASARPDRRFHAAGRQRSSPAAAGRSSDRESLGSARRSFAKRLEVDEFCRAFIEEQRDLSDRSVPMLGDVNLGDALLLGVLVVSVVAVDE